MIDSTIRMPARMRKRAEEEWAYYARDMHYELWYLRMVAKAESHYVERDHERERNSLLPVSDRIVAVVG